MVIHFKVLLFCSILCILFGCSNEKHPRLKTDSENEQKVPIYHTESKQFDINGLSCHWKYDYITNLPNQEDSTTVMLLDKQLIHLKTNKKILTCRLSDLDEFPLWNLKDLKTRDTQPLEFDVNFDGYTDYQYIETHTSGNQHCWVYLYNPKFQNFTYSEELSGNAFNNHGIRLDDSKKMATYTSKGGGGLYSVRQVFFDSLGQIKFQQLFWNENKGVTTDKNGIDYIDFIFYTKKTNANGKTESKQKMRTIKDEGLEHIYQTFIHWVNNK